MILLKWLISSTVFGTANRLWKKKADRGNKNKSRQTRKMLKERGTAFSLIQLYFNVRKKLKSEGMEWISVKQLPLLAALTIYSTNCFLAPFGEE